MTSADSRTTTRAGRPRASAAAGSSTPGPSLSGREQILDAAAALFAEAGFSGTSTRAIADRVGIRQQSLYYHFAGKDELLAELLGESVRPSIDFIGRIEARVPESATPAGALYALATVDLQTLRRTRHNIGTLYLLPEVQDPRFEAFRNQRTELRKTYGRLGVAAAAPAVAAEVGESRIGSLLLQTVEVIIQLRRDGALAATDDAAIADSCLRLLGLGTAALEAARVEASSIIERDVVVVLP